MEIISVSMGARFLLALFPMDFCFGSRCLSLVLLLNIVVVLHHILFDQLPSWILDLLV
jgi:hypothetical protein